MCVLIRPEIVQAGAAKGQKNPTVSALLNAVGTESVRNGALTISVMAGSRYGRHSGKERFCNGGKFA